MFVKPHDVPPQLCFNVQTEMWFGVEQLLFTTPTLWKQMLFYSESHLWGSCPSFNSLRPRDAYMRRWTNCQWNVNQNSNIFIEENTFENVICESCPFRLGLNALSVELQSNWKIAGTTFVLLLRTIAWNGSSIWVKHSPSRNGISNS